MFPVQQQCGAYNNPATRNLNKYHARNGLSRRCKWTILEQFSVNKITNSRAFWFSLDACTDRSSAVSTFVLSLHKTLLFPRHMIDALKFAEK